jgi:NADPH:quinone reductase-like Zn-dependent oxidoreductase
MGPIKALFLKPFVHHEIGFILAELKPADFTYLSELMQSGRMTPVIDHVYPMQDAGEAMRHLEQGHARGKVIVTMEDASAEHG